MFVQKSGRVDDWTCLKSSCQKLCCCSIVDLTRHCIESNRSVIAFLKMQGRRSKSFGQPNCESANEKLTNAEKIPKQSQELLFCQQSLKRVHKLLSIFFGVFAFVLRHCTVKSKKLVWTWLRKGLLSELITTLWWGDIPLGSIKLIWWLYFDVIRSPYLEHDVNTHTPLMVMHYITRDITRILLFCEISKLYKEPDNIRLISIRDVENPSSTAESPGCNWNGG